VLFTGSYRPRGDDVTPGPADICAGFSWPAVGAVALLLVWAVGGPSALREACLSCRPHSAQEHRLWP
jgi:hypothetical protein